MAISVDGPTNGDRPLLAESCPSNSSKLGSLNDRFG